MNERSSSLNEVLRTVMLCVDIDHDTITSVSVERVPENAIKIAFVVELSGELDKK
jgi:hypothetical protein